MKAIDLFCWVVKEHIDTESMDIIEVDKSLDMECFFGYLPEKPVPDGEYAYLYGDTITPADLKRLTDVTEEEPYRIQTDLEDKKNGGKTVIYLLKVEE